MTIKRNECDGRINIEYFKNKIGKHLYREMKIMLEMSEANLSEEEWREIRKFILSHPNMK